MFNQALIFYAPVSNQISGQCLMPLMLPVNHYHLFYLWMARQCTLNFPQFNAVTTDFDLKIIAPQIFQLAIRPPAHQIPGFIQAGVTFSLVFNGGKRICHKPLSSQLRLV
ncbi:hypothetical protein Xcab_04221 [Xenorhabdus cabanillasii JM26]|nr:hypothetical protein Xcab_04221 [Xenorhabdus cabanillasii JM26]